MKLKSFGCSFIFGSDLSDDVSATMFDHSDNGLWIRPSKLTWPALLAKHYGYDYVSHALPGIGNLQILESVLKEISTSTNKTVFVIQWTWIDRFEYENRQRTKYDNFWNTIRPSDQDHIAKEYFKHIHSEYRDKLSSLIYIKTAIDALQQKDIRFIMTNVDDLVFENIWHTSESTLMLQESIKQHIVTFDSLNFLDWSKKNNYPISKSNHPLEEAHYNAANLIASYNLIK